MTTNYPGALDTTTTLPTVYDRVTQANAAHQNNKTDAIIAAETKVGIGSSTPTSGTVLRGTGTGTSAWGQVNAATDFTGTVPVANGGTGAVTLTGILKGNGTSAVTAVTAPAGTIVGTTDTQALTNKTLTSPTLTTPQIVDTGSITDDSGNPYLKFSKTTTAVNQITITNNSAGNPAKISATGSDTDISVDIRGKGLGVVKSGIRYQSDTTNSNQNSIWIQAGWGWIIGDGSGGARETITLPTAFTTTLAVVVTPLGYKDSSDPTSIHDFSDLGSLVTSSTIPNGTTTFQAELTLISGTIAVTRRVGYSWIAIGI